LAQALKLQLFVVCFNFTFFALCFVLESLVHGLP